MVVVSLPFALLAFPFVFGFGVFAGLPLHIDWRIGATARKGDQVINHPSGAGQAVPTGRRASIDLYEGMAGDGTTIGFGASPRGYCAGSYEYESVSHAFPDGESPLLVSLKYVQH